MQRQLLKYTVQSDCLRVLKGAADARDTGVPEMAHTKRAVQAESRYGNELYLGGNDTGRDGLRDIDRPHQCGLRRGAELGEGGSHSVYHDARSHGALDGADGDSEGRGAGSLDFWADSALNSFFVSQYSGGTPGERAYHDELCREFSGTWLGGDPGGSKGDGEFGRAGGGEARAKNIHHAPRRGEQRDVYVFDPEYFLPAVDSRQCHRLPRAVWQCEPHGNCRSGDRGNGGEYIGGGGVLQGDEQEEGSMKMLCQK